jgi:hypothetical protein
LHGLELVVKGLIRGGIRRRPGRAGFTLVELIIASVMALTILEGLVVIVISHLRSTNRTTIHIQARRELSRLIYLMGTEASEGCSLQVAANPASCKQICAAASSSDLRLLTPVVNDAGVASTRVLRYYLSGTQLFRQGPRILLNGRLDLTDLQGATTLLLDDVSAFSARADTNCRSALVSISLSIPNSQQTYTSSYSVRTDVSIYSF